MPRPNANGFALQWNIGLACGKGVTELQNLTNLRLLSFEESHQMQQKNFDVSPNPDYTGILHVGRYGWVFLSYAISLIFKRSISFFENTS